jgi:hypothetical protein
MAERQGWSELHHLAYLYAAVASRDGSITDDEADVLCRRLHRWHSDMAITRIIPVVMAAVRALSRDSEGQRDRQIAESVGVVADALDEGGRATAFQDLRAIAEADSDLHAREGQMLGEIQEAWRVSSG